MSLSTQQQNSSFKIADCLNKVECLMNLQKRLAKLEEKTTQDQPVVVWVNPNESKEEAYRRAKIGHKESVIFVKWHA
jgi:hypothetical protein